VNVSEINNVLEISNVTKRFGNLVAVSDVSLTVARGELCAIIGPNGAGKTTFFNLISGFFPPTSGTITFDGQDITRLATHERVARGMARTFQITEIFPELTVFDNVRIATEVAGGYRLRPWINRAEAMNVARHVDAMLKLVSLDAKSDQLVGELAHGDQRAAEIAMALALKPHLLLLDEPTAGMGDQETFQVTQLIRRLHRDSKYSIVLIEHDMRVVFHLADRICVLDQGRMLAQGTPQEIAANETVQAAYLGNAA
jgi:branched-chain amino acid transport system ATP-binding protein